MWECTDRYCVTMSDSESSMAQRTPIVSLLISPVLSSVPTPGRSSGVVDVTGADVSTWKPFDVTSFWLPDKQNMGIIKRNLSAGWVVGWQVLLHVLISLER